MIFEDWSEHFEWKYFILNALLITGGVIITTEINKLTWNGQRSFNSYGGMNVKKYHLLSQK